VTASAHGIVHTDNIVLLVAVFLACAVEMVEALTIVVAVAVTAGWRRALTGASGALVVLAALVAAIGPELTRIPLSVLRIAVGGVLLVFGLQWLRKAVLRAAGVLAKHDEDAIYESSVAQLSRSDARAAVVVAFKGTFLEGLEVVIIVLTLGTTGHALELATIAALAALVVVAAVGAVVARQLSSVPENAMKMTVGIMLVSFGTFWSGEGVHVRWPGSDVAIVVLAAVYALAAGGLVRLLRRERRVAIGADGV
jgi:Ca2+/H+ antiporter, TMEM165/GDT1 family